MPEIFFSSDRFAHDRSFFLPGFGRGCLPHAADVAQSCTFSTLLRAALPAASPRIPNSGKKGVCRGNFRARIAVRVCPCRSVCSMRVFAASAGVLVCGMRMFALSAGGSGGVLRRPRTPHAFFFCQRGFPARLRRSRPAVAPPARLRRAARGRSPG